MKIGLSFGRCLRDIVLGHVKIDHVMVIVSRTMMETEEHLHMVVRQYGWPRTGPLDGLDLEVCLRTAETLWKTGRIHQPRLYGAPVTNVPEEYIWLEAFPTLTVVPPAVQDAWENYRVLLNLVGSPPPAQTF